MTSLMVSLNFTIQDLRNFLNKNFDEFLDEGEEIEFHPTNCGYIMRAIHFAMHKKTSKQYSIKQIVLAMLNLFQNWSENQNLKELETFTSELIEAIGARLQESNDNFIIGEVFRLFKNKIADKILDSFTKKKSQGLFDTFDEFNPKILNAKEFMKNFIEHTTTKVIKFNNTKTQESKIDDNNDDKIDFSDLTDALAQIIWMIFVGVKDHNHTIKLLGLFEGKKVINWMEDRIQDGCNKAGLVYKREMTFAEFDKLGFKKLYVVAFNTTTLTTDLFSAEHTPNVIVTDAIRASISIPVFFTPVQIRERDEHGNITIRTNARGDGIWYIDGGCLDNYPIWIFDDLKYLIDIPFEKGKILISNPRTLGLRLLSKDIIKLYTNDPDMNHPNLQQPMVEDQDINNIIYLFKALSQAFVDGSQEEIIQGAYILIFMMLALLISI